MRINHDRTQHGWRLKETTVEIVGIADRAGADLHISQTMELLMKDAFEVGTTEAKRRNRVDGLEP